MLNSDKKNFILYHISRIIESNRNKKNFSVLTYNYDNYLELFIDNILDVGLPLKYKSLYNSKTRASSSVSIYHVHGFLPYNEYKTHIKQTHMESIILTEQDYNNLYNDPYRWEITVQLLKYRENSCIFVGLSLTDPNIRRLIGIAKKNDNDNQQTYHYALFKRDSLMSVKDYAIVEKHFNKIGVTIVWTEDYGINILSKLY